MCNTITIVYIFLLSSTPLGNVDILHLSVLLTIHSVKRQAHWVSCIVSAGGGCGHLHRLIPSTVENGLDCEGELWRDETRLRWAIPTGLYASPKNKMYSLSAVG